METDMMHKAKRDRRMAAAPVDFGFAGYLLANRLYERVYGMQFDDISSN